MRAEILASISTYLGKLDPPLEIDLNPETLGAVTLQELELDSLKSLELLMFLEESLGVESPVDQHPTDASLEDIAGHFEALVRESGVS